MEEFATREIDKVYNYFQKLLSSISPLLALDIDLCIRFCNDPFLEEFDVQGVGVIGMPIFSVLNMSPGDKKSFLSNLKRSAKQKVQNCEFTINDRIFGYTVFRFEHEIGIILKEITKTKNLESKVAQLYSRLLELQETERQNLSANLHDGIGQTILAAKLNFIAFQEDIEGDKERFEMGLSLIDQASQELREIYTDLYPSALKELGLMAAIRGFIRRFEGLKSMKIELDMDVPDETPHNIQVNLFRITQEIFTNIVKHSRANKVELSLYATDENLLILNVLENGIGFSPEEIRVNSRGFGLENIRRRVEDLQGLLDLQSSPGKGTQTHIEIPL